MGRTNESVRQKLHRTFWRKVAVLTEKGKFLPGVPRTITYYKGKRYLHSLRQSLEAELKLATRDAANNYRKVSWWSLDGPHTKHTEEEWDAYREGISAGTILGVAAGKAELTTWLKGLIFTKQLHTVKEFAAYLTTKDEATQRELNECRRTLQSWTGKSLKPETKRIYLQIISIMERQACGPSEAATLYGKTNPSRAATAKNFSRWFGRQPEGRTLAKVRKTLQA